MVKPATKGVAIESEIEFTLQVGHIITTGIATSLE
jgi:hypothetical protein